MRTSLHFYTQTTRTLQTTNCVGTEPLRTTKECALITPQKTTRKGDKKTGTTRRTQKEIEDIRASPRRETVRRRIKMVAAMPEQPYTRALAVGCRTPRTPRLSAAGAAILSIGGLLRELGRAGSMRKIQKDRNARSSTILSTGLRPWLGRTGRVRCRRPTTITLGTHRHGSAGNRETKKCKSSVADLPSNQAPCYANEGQLRGTS